ncbi:propionyl-CoA carboxylase alpha chain [Nocardioides luteus]|uniref:Acetyl/propionyl-CoA carboxylase subunit alpha n=1 Tax=Nocardioides luteus TaxID=1844 RepID=A0ABQ5SR99_9ACTN|nr:biotin carboxylase N-terminal domain-containing protein [Nocardioides luteus]MDR7313254.1 propionyl-CoA carboxylase alpha chain [Nocardioides luteus]GGR42999.1 acetyl/propionyl-CoA carboxylase subuit alpha [Nocardioides luteus]GLJ66319.1 acetyl/propionyl-CoA carboxylase subunit alpha [Nocardioides luteus]
MINRILVANRAEIASRVFRTARKLGIETVAVHSDADADLPFVAEADHAVRLPGNAPADTYLRSALVIEAAKVAGADAIHPGYGFLSENADFARAVEAAGLTWIGPAPESIEKMGSKIEAKKIMASAGVPVLEAPASPAESDLPLLVKASAGGGGRGMRIVRTLDALEAEVAAAEAEAKSAFGDGTVFVEPYVEAGRHVEVQVVGDGAGNVAVFGERDCSVQRRHQKVVEESPAPLLPDSVRSALHEAARNAAAAIDYRGAGTVEFLYDAASERFWFLEMNTRLQVEHPVTELVHGVDLVELQVAVAENGVGALGGVSTGSTSVDGHAIEVRLYAEDPTADYQPQSGTLTALEFSGDARIDAGYTSGSEVSTFYDAMLAKVIVHAPTRDAAIRRLSSVLRTARIHGLVTNREQLIGILGSDAFRSGEVTTSLLAKEAFLSTTEDPGAPVAAAIALAERTRRPGIPVAWRNVPNQPQRTVFEDGSEDGIVVEWRGTRDGYVIEGQAVEGFEVVSATGDGSGRDTVVLEKDGLRTGYTVSIDGASVDVDSAFGHTALKRRPRFTDPALQTQPGSLLAPMPGSVISVLAEIDQDVTEGQPLLVLEAMKMQHTVTAPTDGVLTQINVKPGDQVAADEVLAVVESVESVVEPVETTKEETA